MPTRPRTRAAAWIAGAALALATLAACTAGPEQRAAAELAAGAGDRSVIPGQTSEGIEGEHVEPYPDGVLPRPRISKVRSWRMSPGVTYRRWTQTDRRGPVRAHLVRVDLDVPGVSLDYQSLRKVPDRGPLTRLLARDDDALAGVNGGFFDISDTGAPLGIGEDRQRGFLHASLLTWNTAFYLDRRGRPRIGRLEVDARIAQYPQITITNVNSPRVREGSVGIYTSAWGQTSGVSITDGQRTRVRMVVVQGGRVVTNRTTLTAGKPIRGVVLVGRGPGADALRQLRVGSLATVRWSLPGAGAVAISGERVLVRDGRRVAREDSELHPRTAVGIDEDKGRVLLLAVDGRSERSRGLTLAELARMLQSLGAEQALNLDGGGSTTVVGPGRGGRTKVLNSPSDGEQRAIPDGLGVHYRAP